MQIEAWSLNFIQCMRQFTTSEAQCFNEWKCIQSVSFPFNPFFHIHSGKKNMQKEVEKQLLSIHIFQMPESKKNFDCVYKPVCACVNGMCKM